MSEPTAGPLKRTPLHALHQELGARLVPFAGYEMPVQYPTGILAEHAQTRTAAGLFDVSHMGQLALRSRSGAIGDAARALETLVPADIVNLAPWHQRYTLFTNEAGGILDDLMVANLGDRLFLIVNAACKDDDLAHIQKHLSATCAIEPMFARGLMALSMDGLAIGNGIITVETEAQALARARRAEKNKGGEAAVAAIRMMELREQFGA